MSILHGGFQLKNRTRPPPEAGVGAGDE